MSPWVSERVTLNPGHYRGLGGSEVTWSQVHTFPARGRGNHPSRILGQTSSSSRNKALSFSTVTESSMNTHWSKRVNYGRLLNVENKFHRGVAKDFPTVVRLWCTIFVVNWWQSFWWKIYIWTKESNESSQKCI